jgi:segregation and condensation protein B
MEENSESVVIADENDRTDDAPVEPESATSRLDHIVESVLFAAAAPVSLRKLVEILDGPTTKEVQAALARLREEYGPGRRGIQLHEVAGGYQLRTARENAEWVRAVFRDKPARLGRATLETLAIIAYKQPATRAEIEAIRGVDVDGVLNTLLSRRFIKIAGRKEAVGRPLLYSTTPEFLEAFGLKELTELPSLKELGLPPDAEEITTPAAPIADAADQGDAADAADPASAADAEAATDEAVTEPSALGNTADGADGAADTTATAAAEAVAASTDAATAADTAGREAAEDPEPGRDHVAAQGGGAHRGRSRTGERIGSPLTAGCSSRPTSRSTSCCTSRRTSSLRSPIRRAGRPCASTCPKCAPASTRSAVSTSTPPVSCC